MSDRDVRHGLDDPAHPDDQSGYQDPYDDADFPGPGRGKVTFEVESGDTVGQIGRNLKAKGVVESVDAFIEASNGESNIQVGFYQLKKQMRAADAFQILS